MNESYQVFDEIQAEQQCATGRAGEDKIWQQANAAKLRKFQILGNLDFRQKGGGFVEVCPLVGGSSFHQESSTTVLLRWVVLGSTMRGLSRSRSRSGS